MFSYVLIAFLTIGVWFGYWNIWIAILIYATWWLYMVTYALYTVIKIATYRGPYVETSDDTSNVPHLNTDKKSYEKWLDSKNIHFFGVKLKHPIYMWMVERGITEGRKLT